MLLDYSLTFRMANQGSILNPLVRIVYNSQVPIPISDRMGWYAVKA